MHRVHLHHVGNHRKQIIRMAYGQDLPLPLTFPTYPYISSNPPRNGDQYWYVDREIRETFRGKYYLSYKLPNWIIDFELASDAVLFKLTWGGHV